MNRKNDIRQKLIAIFEKWINDYYDELLTEYEAIYEVLRNMKTMEEIEQYACLYHRLPNLKYHMDIIQFGNDEEKFNLLKEILK